MLFRNTSETHAPLLLLPPPARPHACAEYTSGEVIWAPVQPGAGRSRELGLFIVVYGLVRSSFTGGWAGQWLGKLAGLIPVGCRSALDALQCLQQGSREGGRGDS